MQLFMVIGVIAALIYYVLKMRASAKSNEEDSKKSDEQGFFSDMFTSSNNRTSTYSAKDDDQAGEPDEQGEDRPLLSNPYDDLEKLAALHEKGILTQDEYNAKKKDILERI